MTGTRVTARAAWVGAAALFAAGFLFGLPALRLRTFYFAITTLGFATIVTQVALAWQSVTGGGIGISGPEFPAPFNTAWGFYALCIAIAALTTWLSANVARSRFGRALIAVRDAEVAAEACGTDLYQPAPLAAAMADYIDNFYNVERRHSYLGNISPTEFETLWTSTYSISQLA